MNASSEKRGVQKRRKLLCVATAAIAALVATATPARASTMQEIYGGVKVEGLETAQEYVAGDTVFPTYSLVNRSGAPLVVPPNTDFGTTFHLIGVLQHWIERLGPVQTIPSMPPQVFFDGSRYAAGGTIVAVDGLLPENVWAPDLALPYSWFVNTTGFPTGDYRFFVEYKQLFNDGGAVIQTATVDFHVTGAVPMDTTPPTLVVPADITVDATAPDGA